MRVAIPTFGPNEPHPPTQPAAAVVRGCSPCPKGRRCLLLAASSTTTSERLTFLNSRSDKWGKRGRFYMAFDDFETLLNHQGDATAPVPKVAA